MCARWECTVTPLNNLNICGQVRQGNDALIGRKLCVKVIIYKVSPEVSNFWTNLLEWLFSLILQILQICFFSIWKSIIFWNPIQIKDGTTYTDGLFVKFWQMLLNFKINECFHIYKWSFSEEPTTINILIPKWTFLANVFHISPSWI